ncbi:MAG: alpha-hydroxy acid oxidase [Chloroflexota bacterium]
MLPLNLAEYETAARGKIPDAFYDYIAGGAADEITLQHNRSAFNKIALRPRVLVDVDHIDQSTSILGVPIQMPVLVGMTASHQLCHPDGELATARAAHSMGTIMTVGTLSNYPIGEVRQASPGPIWLQLYVYNDMDLNRGTIEQGIAAGAKALVITVDTPYLGRRERDLRNKLVIPPELKAGHLQNLSIDQEQGAQASEKQVQIFRSDSLRSTSMTWDDLATYREMAAGMPFVIKGILTAEDAKLAVDYGMDAIIISNHGGRQLDTSIPTIDALPEVVEAVAGRVPVLIDGGIRRGTDVIKALALGASAVLIGRPVLWGLAVNGEAGVRHVLELLRNEIQLTMALCGKTSLQALDRSLLKFYP